MAIETITGQLILKSKRQKPVLNRHPWVFSGAIEHIYGTPKPGDYMQICDNNGRFLATAYYNPNSQIQARILSWDDTTAIDAAFWTQKLQRAFDGRAKLALEPTTNAYRLVNAEADGLPGLIVDKYGDYLVVQCLTLGIARRKDLLVDLLSELVQPVGIVERSDVSVRRKEGLQQTKGLLRGKLPPDDFSIQENGHQFQVDLLAGHKTGFYLDQRDNRNVVTNPTFVADKSVLNLFAYTGGFAVYAAANGARQIVNIDSSIPALETAERNIALNGLQDRCDFQTLNGLKRPTDEYIAADAFEILRYYRDNEQKFDMVILDPPKFVNSKRDLDKAARGYKDLNWLALRLLNPGGILATFSCSGLLSSDLFQKIIFGAVVDAELDVQILAQLGQAPDHPILLSFPESAYLKGLLCRIW
ncbi:MAG: class I SAM-dependent rRNA methyltransferase [Anaerolineales bacterium]|nr:class I SAM-dependent rRNA methyltransferase [Anaerolineales bacterium]